MLHIAPTVSHMETSSVSASQLACVISAALAEANISQRTAAARTGIPLTTLSRRLTGHSPFLVTELELMASLVGLKMSALVALAEQKEEAA